MHTKTHNMFSSRASLEPTGRRTYSTRETPALYGQRAGFKGGTKTEEMRKNKGKEKSIVVPQNLILLQASQAEIKKIRNAKKHFKKSGHFQDKMST